jgi:hypothetical protein
MPLTISNWTGDGVKDPVIATSIQLPDSGTSVIIAGSVTPTGGQPVTVTGSPVTAPAPPGSGSVYWIIQVNTATGAATVKQSAVAMSAADSGNQIVFAQTLVPGTTDEAANATDVTPDTT